MAKQLVQLATQHGMILTLAFMEQLTVLITNHNNRNETEFPRLDDDEDGQTAFEEIQNQYTFNLDSLGQEGVTPLKKQRRRKN